MNQITYRQLAESFLLENYSLFRGEAWIQDYFVQSADADVDDAGHEAVVIEAATSHVLSMLGIEMNGDHAYLNDHFEEIFEAMQDNLTEDQMERYRNKEMMNVMIEYGLKYVTSPTFKELVMVAFDKVDVRRYAMREWGWKAVRQNVVDTWLLSSADLRTIAKGLGDFYDNEITQYELENKSLDENGYPGPYFDIEVYGNQDYYSMVPFNLIEGKDVSKLRPYKIINKGERITENKDAKKQIDKSDDIEVQKELDTLKEKYNSFLRITVGAYKTHIYLFELIAQKNAPVGTGSSFMKELCNVADKHQKIIFLQTADKGHGKNFKSDGYNLKYKITTSSDRLKQFYKRFGFVSNYNSRDYRPDFLGNMHRYPK